jgi:hypothetical protein
VPENCCRVPPLELHTRASRLAQEADFFSIPTYASCWAFPVSGYNDFPWFHGGPGANRAQAATNMYMEVHSWLRSHHPYWDRRGGADHILVSSGGGICYRDLGCVWACAVPWFVCR